MEQGVDAIVRRPGPGRAGFRLVPQLDRYPRLAAFAERAAGKILLLICFAFFLFLLAPDKWMPLTGALCFFSFLPQYRKFLLLAATLLFLAGGYNDFRWSEVTVPYLRSAGIPEQLLTMPGALLGLLLVLLFCALWVYLAGRSPLAPWIKRPVAYLIVFYLLLLLALSYVPGPAGAKALLWVFAYVFGKYFWYLCYSLRECRSSAPPAFLGELGLYLPFWRPMHVPIPQGSGVLSKIEAKTPQELATVQLKGLKLIIWAFLLALTGLLLAGTLHGRGTLETGFGVLSVGREAGALDISLAGRRLLSLPFLHSDAAVPLYEDAFDLSVAGKPLPFYANWAALLVFFVEYVINLSVDFHIVIAVCRMCGYRALRNTYKPLSSTNIAEFWNRLFYYYKEVMVHFFFFPVFFRYFKDRPKLRLFCATFAAACFGNCIYHLFSDFGYIMDHGLFRAVVDLHCFFLYSFVLATGIFLSQLRIERGRRRTPTGVARIAAQLWVFLFFSVLSIFADTRRESVTQNLAFFFSLFNLS